MEAWAVGVFLMPYACSRSQYSTNEMCAVEMTYLRGFSMAVLSQHFKIVRRGFPASCGRGVLA